MRKYDTLRRLIREAVIAEMARWYGDEPSDDPQRVTGDPRWDRLGDWIEGGIVPRHDKMLELWLREVMGIPTARVVATYMSGDVELAGMPDGEGSEGYMYLPIEDLKNMFYGGYPKQLGQDI